MKENEDIFKDFQHQIEGLKGNLHVLNTDVPVEEQMEYFRFAELIRKGMSELETTLEQQMMFLDNVEPEDVQIRRLALTYLAVSADVKAYRYLEAYTEKHKDNLDSWAKMAMLQARIAMETEFSDEKHIFISTGLGGEGDRIRFFSLFRSKYLQDFSAYQKELIEKEFSFSIRENKGNVEVLKMGDNYFTIVFLIGIKVNIEKMLKNAVKECNEYGDFISPSIIVTNVKILSDEEIQRELYEK